MESNIKIYKITTAFVTSEVWGSDETDAIRRYYDGWGGLHPVCVRREGGAAYFRVEGSREPAEVRVHLAWKETLDFFALLRGYGARMADY